MPDSVQLPAWDHMSPGRRSWERGYIVGAVIGDLGCALLTFLGLIVFRYVTGTLYWTELPLGAALTVAWPVAVAIAGGYASHRIGDEPDEYRGLLRAAVGLASIVAIAAYVTKTPVARSHVMIGIPVLAFAALCFRYGWRKRLHRRRNNGQCMRRIVVVGPAAACAELVNQLGREPYHGMSVVAACLPEGQQPYGLAGDLVVGEFSDVPEVVGKVSADAVAVLACAELDGTELRRMAWRLAETDTDLYVASALMEVAGPRVSVRPVAGFPLLRVEHPVLAGIPHFVKDVFDKVMASLALVVLAPFLALIALAIRMDSAGPAMFTQTRVGKDGREFTLVKFRTMVTDAESLRLDLTEHDAGNVVLFKIREDPRITPVGRWLRRYSIDELPQLLNVLRGEMSLIGPRPPLPEEVAQYGVDVRRRLVLKPGLTGLWQISGRSDLSWEESVRLDLRYVENWSFALDLQIMWKTLGAVTRGTGAY